tara:strand:- start:736 stop:1683 length:948 start_codon:yes stop_codon:yes gene_type:complete
MAQEKLIAVIGGSGFVGRHVVQALARDGHRIRVGVRRVERASFLKPMGVPGQVVPMQANIRFPESLDAVVAGADVVINLVGILQEAGPQKFSALQAEGARAVAKAARDAGATQFIQLSAIGADADSDADYARTKAEGEQAVLEQYPDAVILRPSIVVGPEDQFFNRFAAMARLSPVLPVVSAQTRFQPVFVGDVAKAVKLAVDDADLSGVYELGGPSVYSFEELMRLMLKVIGRKAFVADIPVPIASLMAKLTDWLPGAPLTQDQVKMLQHDNIVSQNARGFDELGLKPEAIEGQIPSYLYRFRRAGQYTDMSEN